MSKHRGRTETARSVSNMSYLEKDKTNIASVFRLLFHRRSLDFGTVLMSGDCGETHGNGGTKIGMSAWKPEAISELRVGKIVWAMMYVFNPSILQSSRLATQ